MLCILLKDMGRSHDIISSGSLNLTNALLWIRVCSIYETSYINETSRILDMNSQAGFKWSTLGFGLFRQKMQTKAWKLY